MISIITNTYNSSKFIHRLYHSLISQSEKNFEWILVDDNSEDNTIEILTQLTSPGRGGMRIYKMPFNSGGTIVSSVGAKKSLGSIVVRIDHDDELVPDALLLIKNYFYKIKQKKDVAGVLFPSVQPKSGRKISSLHPGKLFKYSYFMSKEKESVDGIMALKGDVARHYFSLAFYTRTFLNGAIWLEISKKYFFEYSGGDPILIYHRDNIQSQSNNLKVSNKLVYSFARILDYHDKYYYTHPLKWIRYTLGLIHFTIVYYGSPLPVFGLLSRWSTRVWCALMLPFGVIAHFFKTNLEVVHYKEMSPKDCAEIVKEVKTIPSNMVTSI